MCMGALKILLIIIIICRATAAKLGHFTHALSPPSLLQVLPAQINRLENLQTLLLFINQLTKLPDSLCTMKELRCLWVGNNQIRALPKNFGHLVNLDWGHRYTSSALDGNPLIHPPLEICRMGPQAIDRYMKAIAGDREKEEDRGSNEAGERKGSRPRRTSREEAAVRENGT